MNIDIDCMVQDCGNFTLASGVTYTMVLHKAVDMMINDIASLIRLSGGRLNKKDGLTRYGDSHVKDKTS